MSENEEPDRQAEPAVDSERLIPWIEQVRHVIRGNEALAEQVEPILQAAERFAHPGGWPVPPFQQRLMRAVSAALGELLPPLQLAAAPPGGVEVSATAPPVTVSGGMALPPMRFAGSADVGHGSDIEAVEVEPDWRSIGRACAMVLVAIFTSGLLGVQGPYQAPVGYVLTVIGLAVTLAVLIWNWLRPR
jgi:hypothetical protein